MKNLTLLLFAFLIQSCNSDPIDNYLTLEKDDSQSLVGESSKNLFKIVSRYESFEINSSLKIKEDTTLNFDPFKQYFKRPFYDGVASKYKLNEVPGHLFYKESNGDITKVTFNRLISKNAYPIVETVDEVYYNDKITDRKALNVAASILNVGIAQNEVADLILKDELVVYLPDSLFNVEVIKNLSKKIKPEELSNYYLAKGAVVSSVISKIYKENKFEKNINAGWITVDGSVYNSMENFKQRKDLSLELVSLERFLKLNM